MMAFNKVYQKNKIKFIIMHLLILLTINQKLILLKSNNKKLKRIKPNLKKFNKIKKKRNNLSRNNNKNLFLMNYKFLSIKLNGVGLFHLAEIQN